MRQLLLIVGLLALAMGLLWIGQGTGVINWPQSSFMLDQRPWADRGAGLAVVGLLLILTARRLRR
jgi:membrane protein implicated in regulation of membrane protease activity